MKTLEERVAALEGSNRRWRWCVAVLLVAVVAMAAAKPGSGVADSIRTRSLEIVDKNDRRVGLMRVTDDGSGGALDLFGSGHEVTVGMAARKSGAALVLSDQRGKVAVAATTGENGSALSVNDDARRSETTIQTTGVLVTDKKTNAGVTLRNDNGGAVTVYNPLGQVVGSMSANEDGDGSIMLLGADGGKNGRVQLSSGTHNGSGFFMNDSTGGLAFSVSTSQGNGVVMIRGGTPATSTILTGAAINVGDVETGGSATVAKDFISLNSKGGKLDGAVMLGTRAKGGGGFVSVYNPMGKVVAEMQSDDSNSGEVTVGDLRGRIKKTLSGD